MMPRSSAVLSAAPAAQALLLATVMTIVRGAADLSAAQHPPILPTRPVALGDAPMFYLKDENRTPMRGIVPSVHDT